MQLYVCLKYVLPVLLCAGMSAGAMAQTLLNGSFELNDQACGYNLTNGSFSQSMQFATAFGFQNETDIIGEDCGYGPAADGKDFVGLYSFNGSDSISLELSSPLDTALTYLLRFSVRNGNQPGQGYGQVQIGLSATPGSFGALLYQSLVNNNEWSFREVTFKPALPALHLGVTVASSQEAWVLLDDVRFLCPVADLGPDTMVCEVDSMALSPGISADRFVWSNGTEGPELIAEAPGLYWVEILSGGCLSRDSIYISEFYQNCACQAYVPNVFSPNGDGFNDVFLPLSPCEMLEYELMVYNRWGQVVFRSPNALEGWDGTSRQQPADPGIYAYWLQYRFPYADRAMLQKGDVLLVR